MRNDYHVNVQLSVETTGEPRDVAGEVERAVANAIYNGRTAYARGRRFNG